MRCGPCAVRVRACPHARISRIAAAAAHRAQVLKKFNSAASRPWEEALKRMIPAYGRDINAEPGLYGRVMEKARSVLLEGQVSGHRTARTNANQLFDRLDTGRKGRLTVRDLKKALTLDPKQIDELVTKLDAGKSGEISREKFEAGFATFVTSQVRQLKKTLTAQPLPEPRSNPK